VLVLWLLSLSAAVAVAVAAVHRQWQLPARVRSEPRAACS